MVDKFIIFLILLCCFVLGIAYRFISVYHAKKEAERYIEAWINAAEWKQILDSLPEDHKFFRVGALRLRRYKKEEGGKSCEGCD